MTGNDLINTTALPPGLREARTMARRAKAYHMLRPYPYVSFQTWKEEDRGPLPICRPFVRNIVQKAADWLFLKPVHFKVEEDKAMTDLVNKTWSDNCMGSRSIEAALLGGLSGSVDLKWSTPEQDKVSIEILDPTEQTRLYYDQQDQTKLLMARIQVCVFDFSQKKWVWKREDWTDQYWVTYEPQTCSVAEGGSPYAKCDEADKAVFIIKDKVKNPFGIIPVWRIRNQASSDEWGYGDLWPYFQVVDQINFQRNLGHKANQKRVDPKVAYIDLEQPANDAPDMSDNPGTVEVYESSSEKEGKIQVIEGTHDILAEISEFAAELKRELLNAVGSVDFSPEDITNKGNYTTAVVKQLYAPIIESTTRKRGLYGEDGLSVFFERMSKGCSFAKVKGWKEVEDVQTIWPQVVEMTEDEKTVARNRQALNVQDAFTTHERATRELAVQDGVVDVDELLEETEAQKAENEASKDAEIDRQAKLKQPVEK